MMMNSVTATFSPKFLNLRLRSARNLSLHFFSQLKNTIFDFCAAPSFLWRCSFFVARAVIISFFFVMDVDICRWILEFLLRQPTEERLLQKLVAVMPISDEDSRLKKTALLRTIENDISDASVTERILETMELIEELDKREGIAVSKSMKDAYCAVAVECSAKYFLVGKIDKKGKCVSAISEIWRGRVTAMLNSGKSELVTAELKEWMDDVEEALWDANVRKKLTNMNTRNDALRSVLKYLGEAWAMLGPSFLQLNATLRDLNKKKLMQAGKSCNDCPIKARGKKVSFALDAVRDAGGNDRSELAIPTENQAETRESVAKVSDEVEMSTENLPNVSQDVGQSIKHTVKDAGGNDVSELAIPSANQAETLELVAKVSDEVEISTMYSPNVSRDVGESTEKIEGERIAAELVNQTEVPGLIENANERAVPLADHCPRIDGAVEMHKLVSKDKEKETTCVLPGRKHTVSSRHTRGVKITGPEELVTGTSSPLTAEVKEVQEALRSSMLELQAVVKDPLPNALKVSEALIENLGTKNGDTASPSRSRAIEQNLRNDVANVNMCGSSQNNAPRPNLMERNSTACTFEWNESGDTSPVDVENSTRLHLPNTMKRAVSPLKKYEATKFARRRKIRRWSPLEEDTLRTAVEKYGAGNWKLMWNCYRDIFEGRTEVDLKDKWRNMTR